MPDHLQLRSVGQDRTQPNLHLASHYALTPVVILDYVLRGDGDVRRRHRRRSIYDLSTVCAPMHLQKRTLIIGPRVRLNC